MDGQKFDELTKRLGKGLNRRQMLRGLFGGAGAVAIGAVVYEGTSAAPIGGTCEGDGDCDGDLICGPGASGCRCDVTQGNVTCVGGIHNDDSKKPAGTCCNGHGNCCSNNCVNNICVGDCAPDCDGKACGDDGCGGVCGVCGGENEECVNGQCQAIGDDDDDDDECAGQGEGCETVDCCEGLICFNGLTCEPDGDDDDDDDDDKVTICHFPPGNPENYQIITIDESALPAHEAHGDFIYNDCCVDENCCVIATAGDDDDHCPFFCLEGTCTPIGDDDDDDCVHKGDHCEHDDDCCEGLRCKDGKCKKKPGKPTTTTPAPVGGEMEEVSKLPSTGVESDASRNAGIGAALAGGAAALFAAKYLKQDELQEEPVEDQ